jgi:hypothetical protein
MEGSSMEGVVSATFMFFTNTSTSCKSTPKTNCFEDVFIHPGSEKLIFEVEGNAMVGVGEQQDFEDVSSTVKQHSKSSENDATN